MVLLHEEEEPMEDKRNQRSAEAPQSSESQKVHPTDPTGEFVVVA